jgi:signal transduction histidine kinase/HPt (histidine-containing phosphotransfer) domain-containing protein
MERRDMTDSLLRLLLVLPVALGLPALARTGLLDSTPGQVLGVAALSGLLFLAFEVAVHPRRKLARRARQLAPGGACDGDDWTRIGSCLGALGRQREADRARIRELEARLHRAQAAAECADTAKRAFLANIGHEIRTPMNVIVGMTRLSLKLATLPQQREHLLRADRAAQGLLTQISNLLDLVKLETGEFRLVRSGFAVGDMLAQLTATAAEQATGKGLCLRSELDPRVPSALVGDPDRLHQVLANLLDNALKFTDAGEVVLSCELIRSADAGAQLRFEVRDSGIGIPADKQHTLFELFRQGDTSLTRRHGGSGLGLGLCYRLVQVMGGELRLDSKPDIGSSFHFEVPLSLPGHAPARQHPAAAVAGRRPPAAEQMDLGTTRVRLHGSSRLLRRLLTRFKLDHGDFVADYSSLHAVGDRFGAAQLARALASAAASLGALELREAASRLALKRRAEDDPSLDVRRVSHLLRGLLAEIDRRLTELAADAPAADDAEDGTGAAAHRNDGAAADGATADRPQRAPMPGRGDADPEAAVGALLRQVSRLLADFDAAAVNAFVPLEEQLIDLVSADTVGALRNAVNGFDFATAGELLRQVAEELRIPAHAPS